MAEAKMNGLLFPGQGSQTVGMGKELYEKLPSAKDMLDKADEILGYSLKDLMFNGPAEQLTDTRYAQPAIYTCSAMYLEKVKTDGLDYDYVAGHSLGEYDALLAAGVFDFETGLHLVAKRGEAMAAQNGKGTMAKQKGEKVGIWSAGFGQIAICMSMKEGLNYEWIPFASNTNLFLSGAIDATLAMSYNEYYQLLQAGITLTKDNVYRFSEHGYNVQEDGVYMIRSYYETHRDQARRFAAASKKGWEWAAAHPDEALDIVMRYVQRDHIATNRVMQKLMLDEVLRLQIDRESKKREFRLRPDMVRFASRLMFENNMLSREITYEELTGK